MSEGVTIWRCAGCGLHQFPEPLLCWGCGSQEFTIGRSHQAVVEEVSVIRHMIGQENWQPRRIANVRTAGGPSITVGLRDESEVGTVVALSQEEGAPYGVSASRRAASITSSRMLGCCPGLAAGATRLSSRAIW